MAAEIILAVLLALAAILAAIFAKLYLAQRKQAKELRSSKQSLSTQYGMSTEKFMPFMKNYPYEPKNFRFIGSPVDGVQFEDDKVVFIEFKTSGSRQSKRQKKIERLVKEKRVEYRGFRV